MKNLVHLSGESLELLAGYRIRRNGYGTERLSLLSGFGPKCFTSVEVDSARRGTVNDFCVACREL